MKIIDGKKIAEEKFLKLKKDIKRKKLSLSLAVIQVGKNPVSTIYVNTKKRELEKAGISVSVYRFSKEISRKKLQEELKKRKEDGVILQLPLPSKINRRDVLSSIPSKKDVDLLSDLSLGRFYKGDTTTLPPVVGAVKIILEEEKVNFQGKYIVLLGSGELVGKPLALFLSNKGATVSLLNKDTKNISFFTKNADVVVCGTGVPGILKGEMIKKGAVVIDAGTSTVNGKIKGDVEIESVKRKARAVSPVPGGVGPLTAYCLASNLLILKIKK